MSTILQNPDGNTENSLNGNLNTNKSPVNANTIQTQEKPQWKKTLSKIERVVFVLIIAFLAYATSMSIRSQKVQQQMTKQLQILPVLTQRVNVSATVHHREDVDNYQDLLDKTHFSKIAFNDKREMTLTFSDSEKLYSNLVGAQLKFSPLTNVDGQIVSWTCSVSPDQDNADELQKDCNKSLKEIMK